MIRAQEIVQGVENKLETCKLEKMACEAEDFQFEFSNEAPLKESENLHQTVGPYLGFRETQGKCR